MPRMIKIGEKFINADRLYAIEPIPETRTVRVTYEGAPNTCESMDFNFPDTLGEDAPTAWMRDLINALDPTYISTSGRAWPEAVQQ